MNLKKFKRFLDSGMLRLCNECMHLKTDSHRYELIEDDLVLVSEDPYCKLGNVIYEVKIQAEDATFRGYCNSSDIFCKEHSNDNNDYKMKPQYTDMHDVYNSMVDLYSSCANMFYKLFIVK